MPVFPAFLRLATRLSSPLVAFYALPCLLAIVAAGTVAQKDIGVYAAQKLFFESWVIWAGPVPLPGSYPVLLVLGVGLLAKFIARSQWHWRSAGIVLTHLGALLLLLGGLVTSLSAKEGFILLPEGGTAAYAQDYHKRELVVEKNGDILAAWPEEALRPGAAFTQTGLPFAITIDSHCLNCQPLHEDKPDADDRGFARQIKLTAIAPEKETEQNSAGLSFRITGSGAKTDGNYVLFEPMPRFAELAVASAHYTVRFSRARQALPFEIGLEKFTADYYPGTDKARSFASDIIVRDGKVEWPARIEMNAPLRYKGYTLYQSSFQQLDGATSSILAVVRNDGWVFPYLSSFVLCLGLLLHAVLRAKNSMRAGA